MRDESIGVPPPTQGSERPWQGIWPQKGTVHDVTFLDCRPWGVTTHWRPAGPWGSQRSVACVGEGCEGCGKWRVGWSGYLPVWSHKHQGARALAVTEDRWWGLRSHLGKGETVTGSRWLVYDVRGANHGFRTWERSRCDPYLNVPAQRPNLLPTLRKLYPEVAHLLIESATYALEEAP